MFGDAFPGTVADNFSENSPLYNAFTVYYDNMAPTETTGKLVQRCLRVRTNR